MMTGSHEVVLRAETDAMYSRREADRVLTDLHQTSIRTAACVAVLNERLGHTVEDVKELRRETRDGLAQLSAKMAERSETSGAQHKIIKDEVAALKSDLAPVSDVLKMLRFFTDRPKAIMLLVGVALVIIPGGSFTAQKLVEWVVKHFFGG